MKIFKSKIIFFIMFMTLLLIPSESFAWSTCTISLNDWDLVDSGKHLDWSGSSKYVSQFNSAVNVWN